MDEILELIRSGDISVDDESRILEEASRILEMQEAGAPLSDEELEVLAYFEPEGQVSDFKANLVETMPKDKLLSIGSDVVQWVDWDRESRKEWMEREARGIRLMGVTDNVEGGAKFEGASKAVHPGLIEAAIQFNARAMAEVWPAEGPVKTVTLGTPTPELEQQADRVQAFMNYQYTILMSDAFEEHDKLMFRLPLSGSCFKKVYIHPVDGIVCEFVEPSDFIVPYSAKNLKTAVRYTHELRLAPHELKQYQKAGAYVDVELPAPDEETEGLNIVKPELDAADGKDNLQNENDQRHTLYEMHGYFDLEEEYDGPCPYIVTVDKESYQVLAIYRNWKEGDEFKRPRQWFKHYKFLPGYGFYGFGWLHAIGSLSMAATGSLRALLDSAMFSNHQGGFKNKLVTFENPDVPIGPGEWRDANSTGDDLRNAFFPLPYKEPSATLYNLFGTLDEMIRRVAATTEELVGEGNNDVPVGTTLARIEQGLKVQSGIHKRIHETMHDEFTFVAELNSEWLPEEYPYAVPGEDRTVLRQDFDERVDVIPVSDPNIITGMQRVAQAQLIIERAQARPDLYDPRAAEENLLVATRIPNPENYLRAAEGPQHMGPVAENMAMMTNQPAQAFPDQDHTAHIAVHVAMRDSLSADELPQGEKERIEGALNAHIAEHIGMRFMVMMMEQMGVDPMQPVDPQTENQIALMAAQVTQVTQRPDTEAAKIAMEQQRKDAVAEAEVSRKDWMAIAEQRRKDATTAAELSRETIKAEAELIREFASDELRRNPEVAVE